MKIHYLLHIIFLCLLASCVKQPSNLKIYEGDLAFKLIGLGTFYDVSDSTKNDFLNLLSTLKTKDQLTEGEKYMIRYFEELQRYDLIDLPMIKVNFDSHSKSMTSVFLEPKEFEKIKQFNPKILSKEGVKLRLKFKGMEITTGKIKASEIIFFEKVKGETLVIK